MLSRHAEALFWFGRYVERAEDTARVLDVTYHNLLESPPSEEATAWRELLEVLFVESAFGDRESAAHDVTRYLVVDQTNPGSIIASVARARENAFGVRDRISTELWEAINQFHLDLASWDVAADLDQQPYSVFRAVRNRCQMITGVASQTMPRNDGYRFIRLGLVLERAEMTCRLLAVRYARLLHAGRPMGFHAWLAVLKSVSAYEAYLKAHDASFEPTKVLEFLLLSPTFPRSVLFALRVAESQLDRLAVGDERANLMRLVGRVRARAEFCDIDEVLRGGLDQFLESLQADIYDVARAVDQHFFRAGTDLELHAYQST